MARLTKVKQPIFAGNTTDADEEIAVFGSMKTSAVYTTDLATLMASAEYQEGWSDSVVVGYGPFLEEMNGVQYGFSYQLAYNQQEGIPEWDSATTYYIGSLAKLVTASGCQVYSSKTDNNTGNLVSNTTHWKLVLDSTVDYASQNYVGTVVSTLLSNLYPVGAIYIGTQSTCPLAGLMPGTTWTKVSGDKVLQTSSSGHSANTTISAGLPNITGSVAARDGFGSGARRVMFENASGAFSLSPAGDYEFGTWDSTRRRNGSIYANFRASDSNSIYGNSSTVQPPAYVVNVWRRTA